MPKGDPAGYLPNVKKARKGGKSAKKERLTKKLKHKKGVDNPFALANYIMAKH